MTEWHQLDDRENGVFVGDDLLLAQWEGELSIYHGDHLIFHIKLPDRVRLCIDVNAFEGDRPTVS